MMVGRLTVSLLLAGALLLATAVVLGAHSSSQSAGTAPVGHGALARFTYLAGQGSNRCSLDAHEIGSMPSDRRLQGSCCYPMDAASYRHQVEALRRYRAVALIPRDPYDISVALVKRLLRLRSRIGLTPAQRGTYRQGMAGSPEHGPCCCHCWRWEAFEGLGKYLVGERHWSAKKLAALIGDLDGCGGAG